MTPMALAAADQRRLNQPVVLTTSSFDGEALAALSERFGKLRPRSEDIVSGGSESVMK